jgi:TonB family protein
MNVLRISGPWLVLLLACAIKITFLLGLAWLLASAARRLSAAFRHWIWLLGILGSLALPFLTLLLPSWHSAMLRLPRGTAGSPGSQTLYSTTIDVVAASPSFHNLSRVVLLLWAAGFAVVSLRLAAGIARLTAVSARSQLLLDQDWLGTVSEFSSHFGIARRVRVLQCGSRTSVPLTWGIFRPLILLPAVAREWPEERRRIVIGHELAHVARNDWILQIFAELARGFYWFHPLAWKAVKSLREQSECACDDAVLNCGIEPAQYANELLDLARTLQRSSQAWSAALAFSRPSNFERRLTSMLNPSRNRRRLSVKARLLAVLPGLCLLLPLAAVHLPAQPASERFTGIVYDPSGAPVPDATITLTNSDSSRIEITRSGAEGSFKFAALAPGQYEMKVVKPGFAEYKVAQITVNSGQESAKNVNLKPEVVRVTLKVEAEGTAAADKRAPLHVGGEILEPRLLKQVEPEYPSAAKAAGIEGTVLLNAIIGKKGNLLSLRVMNSEVDPELASAALAAVSQWQYSPVLLNGDPIEVETTITVNFKLLPKAHTQ